MQDKNERGLVGDFFCGAGGASVGIEEFGVKVDFAVNHDQTAIRLHSRNHPSTYHMTEDIFTSEVERFVAGRKVSLIWASPDCTHFSKAKGDPGLVSDRGQGRCSRFWTAGEKSDRDMLQMFRGTHVPRKAGTGRPDCRYPSGMQEVL